VKLLQDEILFFFWRAIYLKDSVKVKNLKPVALYLVCLCKERYYFISTNIFQSRD